MPARLDSPLLTFDTGKVHKIDTSNVDNLFSIWTVFNRCAESIEHGRRLENLSWRLWARETLVCEKSEHTSHSLKSPSGPLKLKKKDVPELSSSVDSITTSPELEKRQHSVTDLPCLTRTVSSLARSPVPHITSQTLERLVETIKEDRDLEPLPEAINEAIDSVAMDDESKDIVGEMPTLHHTITLPSPVHSDLLSTESGTVVASPNIRPSLNRESSSSTTSTQNNLDRRDTFSSMTTSGSLTSSSIIKGFSPGRVSSFRSKSALQLAPIPSPVPPTITIAEPSKKPSLSRVPRQFILGSSQGPSKKVTSFKEEVESRTIANQSSEDAAVFDDSDDSSSNAIDEDDSEWEDSSSEADEEPQQPMFQRIASRPQLTSRPSMLSALMAQPSSDNLNIQSSKSQPHLPSLRRNTSRSGPSTGTTPPTTTAIPISGLSRNALSQPQASMALSPRTTRRNMLASELTESLRTQLLTERRRRNDVHPPRKVRINEDGTDEPDACEGFTFDHGLDSYHQSGW